MATAKAKVPLKQCSNLVVVHSSWGLNQYCRPHNIQTRSLTHWGVITIQHSNTELCQAPTNSSDIPVSFRDLFVPYCLWCIYSKSRILILQNDMIAKGFRRELAEIWTWKQFNNGKLTVLNTPASTLIVKSNYPGFFKENLYEMFFSHTVSCTTSDDILRYVGVFYHNVKGQNTGIPDTNDLVCEWLKVKSCRTQVQNTISVFQKRRKVKNLIQRLGGTLKMENSALQWHLLSNFWKILLLSMFRISEKQSYWNLANFLPQLGAFLRHYHINIKSYGQWEF
jgi:hypothetical protein